MGAYFSVFPFHLAALLAFMFPWLTTLGCTNRHNINIDRNPLPAESSTLTDPELIFPVQAGDFRRIAIFQNERPEVGAEYTIAGSSKIISARVYLYPPVAIPEPGAPLGTLPLGSAPLIEKDFEKHKQALMESHPGSQLIFESQLTTTVWDYPRNGKIACLAYQEPSTLKSWKATLLVYPAFSNKWALRYVFTFPDESTIPFAISACQQSKIAVFQRDIPLRISTP